MGFNRGQGLEFTPLPLSSDENQINIDKNSGTPSTLGRFIYEVSGTTVTRGGCASGDLIAGTTVTFFYLTSKSTDLTLKKLKYTQSYCTPKLHYKRYFCSVPGLARDSDPISWFSIRRI